ncbi:MAG TPA: CbrC family protein [Verrucomicrobiae bacterium]|jgi:hypothetical protein|nr:CbrC family protein [Verrucomicrobiae bacterium]
MKFKRLNCALRVMILPSFKYHPDPIATGSIRHSEAECKCCHQQRGYIYVGPIFSIEELDERICPWCIADGSAHVKFDVEFTDANGVGGNSKLPVPESVIEEVAFRTPGFSGWQQEHWLACCGDAAAFVGRAGWAEIESWWRDAVASIQKDGGMTDGMEWQIYLSALNKEGSPTAYIFKCLHCGGHLGYSDCH